MRTEREKFNKIIATFITIIIFISYIVPTIVVATDERIDYSVIILPGEGKIQTNLDECKGANAYNGFTYISCSNNDFYDIDSIDTTVRENENIKNRIDYTKNWGTTSLYCWANDGYITDTKIVKNILKNGINTSDYGTSRKFSENLDKFGDFAYSTECEKVYLFIPPEGKYFSHFIDQDGNTFNLGDTVTRDLILTPIYTEDEVESVLMNQHIYNVTFLRGEGQIYYKAESQYNNSKDGNVDEIEFQSYGGKNNFYDISQSYAKFRYSDYEKGIEVLKKGKEEVLKKIEEGNIQGAKECFQSFINYAFNELFFTEWLNFTVNEDDPSAKYYRENAMSFGILLTMWIEVFGKEDCSAENLSAVLELMDNFEELTDEEKQNAIDRLVITMNAFEKAWDEYTYSDIFKPIQYSLWTEDYALYKMYGPTYTNLIYFGENTENRDDSYFFIPPSIDYEFSHFVDQDGEIFKLGDPITKDLILTPVYVKTTEIEGNTIQVKVNTEDNSDENFEIDIYKEADKVVYNILNDKSTYTFNENDWTIDENGIITSFDLEPSKLRDTYTFPTVTVHVPSDEHTEEHDVTKELGGAAIGIPEVINGIEVKGISSNAFAKYKMKYESEKTGDHIDYYEEAMFIYLPKTFTSFGNNDWNIFNEECTYLQEEIDGLKEDGYRLICTECFEGLEDNVTICTNCGGERLFKLEGARVEVTTDGDKNINMPPTINMPNTYITVDPESESFTAIHGSLYNKDITKLYYLSGFSQGQNIFSGNWWDYEPLLYKIIEGIEGMEIPSTVSEWGLCSMNYLGELAIHYYGNGFKFEDVNLPTKAIVSLVNEDGESVELGEEELEDLTYLKIGLINDWFYYFIDEEDNPIVKEICELFGISEYSWEEKTDIFEQFLCDGCSIPIICLINSVRNKINTSGIVSKDNPLKVYISNKFDYYMSNPEEEGADPFVRSIRFRNLPDRYIAPKSEDLTFTIDDKDEGVTINLMLKKGNVCIKSIDTDVNNISAKYNIVDENGNVIEEISSSDGSIVTSNKLTYGKYKVVPTEIKEGYKLPTEQEFEITEDGQVIEIVFNAEKEQTPVNPEPEEQTPVNPEPEDPTPVDPEPEDPTPVNPEPEDPTPVNPEPEDPTPVDPEPEDSTPVDPQPEIPKENIATNKMPYTGIAMRTLIIIFIISGIILTAYVLRKIYKG